MNYALLLFVCPKTNKRVPTGIETDVQNLQALWKETLRVKCPYCSEMHAISVRETYINGALSDAADRPPRDLSRYGEFMTAAGREFADRADSGSFA
jgi:hypothetical protein